MQKGRKECRRRLIAGGLASMLAVTTVFNGGVSARGQAASGQAGAPAFQFADNGGGRYTDAYQNIVFTRDGGYAVMGYTMGDSSSPEWDYLEKQTSNHTNNDAVLVKYNSNNQIEWSKAYGNSGVTVFNAMDVLKNGDLVMAGRAVPAAADTAVSAKIKNVSWHVVIVDAGSGEIKREYYIGGTAGDQAFGVAGTDDGGFVVGGWSASAQGYLTSTEDGGQTCTDLIPLWQSNSGKDASLPRKWKSGGADDVIIKVNAEGGVDFCTLHNYAKEHNTYTKSSPAEKMDALTLDADGAVIITAQNEVAKDINNAVIAKFSGTDGKLLWDRMAGSSSYQTPDDGADKITTSYRAVAVLTDGSYVVAGSSTNDAATEEGWTCTSARDTIVVHYQSDGTFIHAESFGRAGDSASRPEGIAAAPALSFFCELARTSKGVIVTAAAGNSSTAESTGEDDYLYPASYDTVIRRRSSSEGRSAYARYTVHGFRQDS